MAYTNFTLDDLESKFGVKNQVVHLFSSFEFVVPSQKLNEELEESAELPVRSEKAKSELIVFPILKEIRRQNDKFFTIYSGEFLNVDESIGLNGECDFILTKDTKTFNLNYPIIQVVEAKRNDIDLGVPQCAAQMVGSKMFNDKKGVTLDKIYGCITTGDEWLFMCLENNLLKIDNHKYHIGNLSELLGVFQQILNYYKIVLK
jgi:hypothetical protein